MIIYSGFLAIMLMQFFDILTLEFDTFMVYIIVYDTAITLAV